MNMDQKRIFVLDDSESDRKTVQWRIEDAGMMSTAVADVQSAIALLGIDNAFDGYLLDMRGLHKPDDSNPQHSAGPELSAHLIHELGVSPDKIILMSGFVSEDDRVACEAYDIDVKVVISKAEITTRKILELFQK